MDHGPTAATKPSQHRPADPCAPPPQPYRRKLESPRRHRRSLEPPAPLSTPGLTSWEEALVVELRRALALPLDDTPRRWKAAQFWRAASRSRVPVPPRHNHRTRLKAARRLLPRLLLPGVNLPRTKSEAQIAATGRPPSTAPVAPPPRLSPAAPCRSSVASFSRLAPSNTTERLPLRLQCQIQGLLHWTALHQPCTS
jgi:hypothetical protein